MCRTPKKEILSFSFESENTSGNDPYRKISGKLKQASGKLTDNPKLQAEGKLEELKGKAKDLADNAYRKVTEKYTWPKRAENILSFIKSFIGID